MGKAEEQNAQTENDNPGREKDDPTTAAAAAAAISASVPEVSAESEAARRKAAAAEVTRESFEVDSMAHSGTLFFSTIPRVRLRNGATPAEISRSHMDRSAVLEELLEVEYPEGKDLREAFTRTGAGGSSGSSASLALLGELEMAFIAFLLGQNFDAFEHWKELLLLLCSCATAPFDPKYTEFFVEFIRTLFAQISQMPDDLFVDELLKGNFLSTSLAAFFEVVGIEGAPKKLRQRIGHLRKLLDQKFGQGWEELLETQGEDAPVVVELPGEDAPVVVDLPGQDFRSEEGGLQGSSMMLVEEEEKAPHRGDESKAQGMVDWRSWIKQRCCWGLRLIAGIQWSCLGVGYVLSFFYSVLVVCVQRFCPCGGPLVERALRGT